MVEKSINMAFLMSLVLKIIYKSTTPRKIKLLNLAETDNANEKTIKNLLYFCSYRYKVKKIAKNPNKLPKI